MTHSDRENLYHIQISRDQGGVATFDSNLPAKSEVGYQPGDYHHMLCLF